MRIEQLLSPFTTCCHISEHSSVLFEAIDIILFRYLMIGDEKQRINNAIQSLHEINARRTNVFLTRNIFCFMNV